MTKRILIIISIVVVIVAGRYIYKAIYPPIVASNPVAQEVQAIKQEVIKDRVIIKEVVRDAKQEVVAIIDNLPDDAVADEWNERLRQYRLETSGDSSE